MSWFASAGPGPGSTPPEVAQVRPAAAVVPVTPPLPDATSPGLPGSIVDLCLIRCPEHGLEWHHVPALPQHGHGVTVQPELCCQWAPPPGNGPSAHDSPAAGVGPVKSTGLVTLLPIALASVAIGSSGPAPLRIWRQQTLSPSGWVSVAAAVVATSSSGLWSVGFHVAIVPLPQPCRTSETSPRAHHRCTVPHHRIPAMASNSPVARRFFP